MAPGSEPSTAPPKGRRGRHGGVPAARGEEPAPEAVLAEPPDAVDVSAELAAPPRRPLPWTRLLLAGGLLVALGFVGGALVQKHQGTGAPGRAMASGATAGRGSPSRAPGGPGSSTGSSGYGTFTTGTVKLVDGNTLYVENAQGKTITVKTSENTTVTVDGKLSDLKKGDRVTIMGSGKSTNGLTAKSISEGSGGFPRAAGPTSGGRNGTSGGASGQG